MAFGSMAPEPSIGQTGMNIFQNAMKQPGAAQQAPGGLLAAIQAAMAGNPTGGLAKSLFGGATPGPSPGMPGAPANGQPGGVGAMNPQMGLLAKMFPQLGMGNAPSPTMAPPPMVPVSPVASPAMTGPGPSMNW